jgi:signal transduction histidine kinase
LNIYASELEALDVDEVELLNGLANDLAYGIMSLRTREERDQAETDLRTLANKLVQTQEEERRHIARELHDETGSYLTILKLLIHRSGASLGDKAPPEIAEAEGMLKELMGQVRNLSLSLRPGMLDDLGLLPALQWYLEDFSKKTGIQVESNFNGLQRDLSQEMRTAAYRIIQEALTNVLRYAKTEKVTVVAQANEDRIFLQIRDEGVGFNPSSIPSNSSGIRGIKERTRALGGKCSVDSAPGEGTCITVEIPLPETRGLVQSQ